MSNATKLIYSELLLALILAFFMAFCLCEIAIADNGDTLGAHRHRLSAAAFDDDYDDEEEEEFSRIFVNTAVDINGNFSNGPVFYGDTVIAIDAYGGDVDSGEEFYLNDVRITVTVGKKTFSAKTGSAGLGSARVKIPLCRVGTIIKVKAKYKGRVETTAVRVRKSGDRYSYLYGPYNNDYEFDDDDDPYVQRYWDIRESFNDNVKIGATYKTSKGTKIAARYVTKGDYFKVEIGKRVYTKKIKKTSKKVVLIVRCGAQEPGTKIKVTHYNKFKQEMGKASSIVFEGNKLKKGMTKSQVKLLRLFGKPDQSSSGKNGWWNYKYGNGSMWKTVYFRDNCVERWVNW